MFTLDNNSTGGRADTQSHVENYSALTLWAEEEEEGGGAEMSDDVRRLCFIKSLQTD